MEHNDLLGKQPAENQLSRSIAEPLLLLFLAGLLGGTTGRPLVLGQVLLVGSQVTAETLDHLGGFPTRGSWVPRYPAPNCIVPINFHFPLRTASVP